MSSYAHWYGEAGRRVDASNQYQEMRTNQATCDSSNRAGERQRCVFTTNLVYYSFTISSVQCGKPVVTSHFDEVCAKRITCPANPDAIPAKTATTGQGFCRGLCPRLHQGLCKA